MAPSRDPREPQLLDDPERLAAIFLADYLTGTLPADLHGPFERHLAVCSCRAYLAACAAMPDVARAAWTDSDREAGSAMPEDLVRAILDSLRRPA